MNTLLLDHLWQSTWFVLFVALLALCLRRNGAHVRYGVWLAASIKFLVPFSLLALAGNQMGLGGTQDPSSGAADKWVEMTMSPATALARSGAAPALPAVSNEDLGASRPAVAKPEPSAAPQKAGTARLTWLVGAIWLSGTILVFLLWFSRWIRLRRLLADAVPLSSSLALDVPIPVLETATRIEPGIAGIARPVMLLPRGITGRLPASQLRAVVQHELAHWRRRDNLTASIQMVVEAVFWFHPLVWWIGAQLIREREYACDEAVLQRGEQPKDYAEGLLNVCQYYIAPPLRTSSISGGELKLRVQRIATNLVPEALGLARKVILVVLGIAVVTIPLLFGSNATTQAAQALAASRNPYPNTSVEALYLAARQEGEVSLMAMDARDATWMSAAFARDFPGIRIRITPTLGHLPLVMNDAESANPRLDVILTSLIEGNALAEGGYLADTDWTLFKVPARRIGLHGRFAYTNTIVYTFAYDERRVSQQEVPRSWRDLLDPRFRSLMSTNAFVMPRVVAGLGLAWGGAAAESYARDLVKSQDMLISFGDAKLFFLDAANSQRFFVGMASTVTDQWESQGVPSGYVVPEPVVMEQQGTAVLASAPHPAAARLLAGWLASEKARAIRHQEAQSSDLTADSQDPLALALRARNVRIVYDTSETTGERARIAETVHPVFTADPNNPYRPLPRFRIPLLP